MEPTNTPATPAATNTPATPAPAANEPKLTPEQEAALTERLLTKAKKSWEKEKAAADEEAKRQASMSAEDRAKELEKQLNAKEAEFEAKLARAERKSALGGKVQDIDYAMYKLEQAGDKYTSKDGSLDVEAFLKDFPSMAVQPQTPVKKGPVPTTAGGGKTLGVSMNDMIRAKVGR